jgi:hypothetical protein
MSTVSGRGTHFAVVTFWFGARCSVDAGRDADVAGRFAWAVSDEPVEIVTRGDTSFCPRRFPRAAPAL